MNKYKLVTNVALGLSALSLMPKAQAKPGQKPNILYILTDDQRYDSIQAFNRILTNKDESPLGYVESPNVDRLAEKGTTFINNWVHSQGCAPSRAAMLLGRYPHRTGIYEFEWFNPAAAHMKPNMPEVLRTFDYQTMHVGKLGFRGNKYVDGKRDRKYDRGYDVDINFKHLAQAGLTDWTKEDRDEIDGIKLPKPKIKWKKKATVHYFYSPDEKYDYFSAELNETKDHKGHNSKIAKKYDLLFMYPHKKAKADTPGEGEIIGGVSSQPAGKTRDGYYTKGLENYLDNPNKKFKMGKRSYQGVDPSKPLFVHLGYDFPHTPVLPPKSWRDKFKNIKYKIPKFDKKEHKKLPKQLKKIVEKKFTDSYTKKDQQQMVQDYYAFCAYGDHLIGQAYDKFVEYSEKNNQPWMVIYVCGDHGWKLNEHGATYKFTPWKEDSQNPFIVVSSDKKKFPAGKVVKDFTEFVDIMPTALAAAGADLSKPKFSYLDGYDLAKVASKELPAREYVLSESHAVTGPRATIRTKDFMFSMKIRPRNKMAGKDLKWAMDASYKQIEPLMYNTSKDPNESKNIAFDKEYEKVAKYLREKLQNILLGDGRTEMNWGKWGGGTESSFSDFAKGADDKKISLP